MFFEPMMQVEVQKLAAIFAIPSEQVEWLNFPDRLQCLEAGVLPPIPLGSQFCPTACDFHAGHPPNEISTHVAAAVGYSVDFGPTSLGGVPVLRMDFHERFDGTRGLGRADHLIKTQKTQNPWVVAVL